MALAHVAASNARADGPADNLPHNVRRIPPLGVELSEADRAELEQGAARLAEKLQAIESHKDAEVRALWPDVAIFHRAVATALEHQEFFSQGDVAAGKRLLAEGLRRADALLAGNPDWTTATGLVVRGFVSRIDHTVQPYGLVIPESYRPRGSDQFRLDLWFHGRGEKVGEVRFIDQRMRDRGQYAPRDAFVLHPYGRYSNAFRFAGEVDVLEALAAAREHYRIDPDRISARGFSMGGAGCWQFAVHYADRWFAANPGAGFSETVEFLREFQHQEVDPPDYQRKLFHLYDCTDYAANLFQCPTIAYSGELDKQKQAADIMAKALAREGIDLTHVIGPGTKHRIHPDSKKVIERRMASLAEKGRRRAPKTIHFVTYTLKYNRMNWVRIDRLNQHWERARVDAELLGPSAARLRTSNVAALTLSMPAGWCPLALDKPVHLEIDGQSLEAPRPKSDRSWLCQLRREEGAWRLGPAPSEGLRKKHDLQGPIDDAFMDSFIIVRPTGQGKHPQVDRWARSEMEHAVEHWRRQFRGDARVKDDTQITPEDIASANLILFGDPSSNAVLAKIIDQLPLGWNDKQVTVGDRQFDAADHAPVLIYPNPLNPERYVVLNSGFTYREYAYLNNARQTPKLPDWAVIDTRQPPDSRAPGKVAAAGFFDERWRLPTGE
jgi:pimeloyl-ACP methyl ester carboxylesterase